MTACSDIRARGLSSDLHFYLLQFWETREKMSLLAKQMLLDTVFH